CQSQKAQPGQRHRMAAMAALPGQADSFRMRSAEIDHGLEGVAAQMRLVSQRDGPVGQACFPPAPLRRALNGTEHAALWGSVPNTVCRRNAKAVEFGLHGPIARGADHRDLLSTQSLPLLD